MNRPLRTLLLSWLSIGVNLAATSEAQPALQAGEIAARVQSFYDRTATIRANFQQRYFLKLYDREETSSGTVVFKKPGRMRWNYDEPHQKVIVSNGQTLKVYEPPREGETRGQGYQQSMDDNQLPAVFAFLTGTGRLDEQFTFRLLDTRDSMGAAWDGYVLQLRPRSPSPHFEQVLFYVRLVEGAGIVERVLIVDPVGNRNLFEFQGLRFTTPIEERYFEFRFPRGTRIVTP
ncbi:MAG: outer membrane lipoprotein carrier protein LolA [Myxococcota bacterium]